MCEYIIDTIIVPCKKYSIAQMNHAPGTQCDLLREATQSVCFEGHLYLSIHGQIFDEVFQPVTVFPVCVMLIVALLTATSHTHMASSVWVANSLPLGDHATCRTLDSTRFFVLDLLGGTIGLLVKVSPDDGLAASWYSVCRVSMVSPTEKITAFPSHLFQLHVKSRCICPQTISTYPQVAR